MRAFVEATQRGYAAGLKDDKERTRIEYYYRDDSTPEGIDKAYLEARS